ncbi:MAG: hypothetical protein BroJett011_48370 [Chloroflexota bacterium]|nr:MAG: hypothetical protein BroJett011_48370 [Chloroflexota bacterium]
MVVNRVILLAPAFAEIEQANQFALAYQGGHHLHPRRAKPSQRRGVKVKLGQFNRLRIVLKKIKQRVVWGNFKGSYCRV